MHACADYMYMEYEAYGGMWHEIINNPAMRFERLLPRSSDPWIQGMRKVQPHLMIRHSHQFRFPLERLV